MGVATSRELEECLHAVNTAGNPNPSLLFEDSATLAKLTRIWNEVPKKYKSKFTEGRSRRVDRLPKIQSKAKITLDPSIKQEYTLWKSDPSTILQQAASQLDYSPNHPVPGAYHALLRGETRGTITSILRRFYCIKLYKLKNAFNSKSLRGQTRDDFNSLILGSGLTEDEKRGVPANVERWTRAGRRYQAIAENLNGTGSLLLLPNDISPAVWEELLPSKGIKFDEMMTYLEGRGICEEAERIQANDVAKQIEIVMENKLSICQYQSPRLITSRGDGNATAFLAEKPQNSNVALDRAIAKELETIKEVVAFGDQTQMTMGVGGQKRQSVVEVTNSTDDAGYSRTIAMTQPPHPVQFQNIHVGHEDATVSNSLPADLTLNQNPQINVTSQGPAIDDTMAFDPSEDLGAFGSAFDPSADFLTFFDPSSDLFLQQEPHWLRPGPEQIGADA